MEAPKLIEAGDKRVLLGALKQPPLADIRVISEENYQFLISILERVYEEDFHRRFTYNAQGLQKKLMTDITKFLEANAKTKER